MAEVKKLLQKGVAVSISVLLVLLLWPVLPMHHAQEGRAFAVTDYTFGDPMAYDTTAADNLYLLKKPLDALFDADDAANNITRPGCPTTTDQDIIDAVTAKAEAKVPEGAQLDPGSVSITSVEWASYKKGTPEVDPNDADLLEVAADEAGWTFEVLSGVTADPTATVKVSIETGTFNCAYQCSYTDSEGTSVPSGDSVEVELSNGADPSSWEVSYVVSLTNIQEQDKDALAQFFTNNGAVDSAYQTEQVLSCDLQAQGSYEVSATSAGPAALSVTASCDSSRLNITYQPLEMFASSLDITVTITGLDTDPDAVPIEHHIQVRPPAKKTLNEVTVPALPFRFYADQKAFVKKAINDQASALGIAACDSGTPLIDENTFGLVEYGADAGSTGATVAATFSLTDALAEKYVLANTSCDVTINAIQVVPSQEANGFSLGAATKDNWVNAPVSAAYAGHKLAKLVTDEFKSGAMPLNTAEGSYANVELFAQDDTTKIVTKVTGIAYNLDMTKPRADAFSIEGAHEQRGFDWFFHDVATVTVAVSDPAASTNTTGIAGDGKPTPNVSGLVSDGARIEYSDARSGARTAEGFDIYTNDRRAGRFVFSVDGDQDTDVSSYKVYARDAAGNQIDPDMSGVKEIPAEVMKVVADSGNPQLTVAYNNNDVRNDSYYNNGRTGVFTVTEPNFRYIQQYDPDQIIVSITEDGQVHVFRAAQFQNVGGDAWQASYSFTSDADYEVAAQVTDLVGKSSEAYTSSFTVDKTAPSINVTFDNESATSGNYYSAARTATISITERNFSSGLVDVALTAGAGNGSSATPASQSGWSSDGTTHTCTVSFAGPGVYSMAVSGTDMALNGLPEYTAPEFVVDTEKPQISIQVNGDTDASTRAYREGCGVSVSIDDTNIDPSSTVTITPIGLNGSANPYMVMPSTSATQITYASPDPARSPENDNVYRLEVNAMDMAGNTETKVIDWSVNRFGSTYVLHDATQEMVNRRYLKTEDLRDVGITEINPSGLNEDDILVSLASGAKNTTLNRGEHYSFASNGDSGWPAYEYVIGRDNFASDGTYQVMIHSTDAAGNASMNTMDNKSADRANTAEVIFSVDNTAPIVTFNGFNESSVSANAHEVGFSIEDNTMLDRAVVRLNGEKVKTLDADALQDPANLKLTLYESADNQLVTVEAYDKANNMDPQDSPSIFVNSNPLLRFFHDPLMVVGAIVGIAAVAAAVIFLLIPFLRRRRQS